MSSALTISLIQTKLHWENKTANLGMLEEKIISIPGKTELVILPEMFSTGFSMNTGVLAEKTINWCTFLNSAINFSGAKQ